MAWLNDARHHRAATAFRNSAIWRYCAERGEPFMPIDPRDDAILRERMLFEVEHLERLTGRDLSAWKLPSNSQPSGKEEMATA